MSVARDEQARKGGRRKVGSPVSGAKSITSIERKLDDKVFIAIKPREEEIIKAAAGLFRTKGYHGTSMADLATLVGIQKASLYYHFKSKDELLSRILQAGVGRVVGLLNDVLNANLTPREQLLRFVEQNVLMSTQWADGFWVMMNEGNALPASERERYVGERRKVDRLLTRLIERGIKTGHFRPVDAKITALSISSMVTGMLRWYRPTGRLKRPQIAEYFVDFVDAMLAPRVGGQARE